MRMTLRPCPICGKIRAISSKSIAHRALICAALSKNPEKIFCTERSADIDATVRCLSALGASIRCESWGFTLSPIDTPQNDAILDCGESGSTLRFLLPVVAALGVRASFVLHGRLSERPLSPLWELMEKNGVTLSRPEKNTICIEGKLRSGTYKIAGDVSSQFISGLLLALPLTGGESNIILTSKLESAPYVDMTLNALQECGIAVETSKNSWHIPPAQSFRFLREPLVEGDWSNAAFWLCGGAISNSVTVENLNLESAQGDRAIIDILRRFGAEVSVANGTVTVRPAPLCGIEIDASNIPDLVPPIALVAACAKGKTRIYGAERLKIKESNRLLSVSETLNRLGGKVTVTDDGLEIEGGTLLGGTVSSCNDHRIAMLAAIASTVSRGDVVLEGAEAVEKSYPCFWRDFEHLRLKMNNTFGNVLKLRIFGASHAPEIGMTLEGFPRGLEPDMQQLQAFMARRAPGQGAHTTARREPDVPIFEYGLTDGKTDGTLISAIIRNTNVRSKDYVNLREMPRPSHADYPARLKYGQLLDMRGSGPFSGRMTAPMCIAGGLCLQQLAYYGIKIGAQIQRIGNVENPRFDQINPKIPSEFANPTNKMLEEIALAKADGDSIGGVIECAVTGLPVGIGEPMFGGLENRLAQILFAIPAVKGVEFGSGFDCAKMRGSDHNDIYYVNGAQIRTRTNHAGGILGGLSTAMPLIFRVAIKPTPSISKPQESISYNSYESGILEIKGRHDPCIVPRAVPVVEAAAAIAILDAILEAYL